MECVQFDDDIKKKKSSQHKHVRKPVLVISSFIVFKFYMSTNPGQSTKM